jgi:hypothetical protein
MCYSSLIANHANHANHKQNVPAMYVTTVVLNTPHMSHTECGAYREVTEATAHTHPRTKTCMYSCCVCIVRNPQFNLQDNH